MIMTQNHPSLGDLGLGKLVRTAFGRRRFLVWHSASFSRRKHGTWRLAVALLHDDSVRIDLPTKVVLLPLPRVG